MSAQTKTPARRSPGKPRSAADTPPSVSIVIPVYNEEGLLWGSVVELVERMKAFELPYTIFLCQNGSTDKTLEIALDLERKFDQVRVVNVEEANYGAAMRAGILAARGTYVICDEIDILDTKFYRRALDALLADQSDMVVGSKLHPDAHDKRPLFRHTASQVINLLLRLALDFRGTDTHGLKAFHRERLLPVVHHCVVDRDLFASEFIIRAEREGYRILELPVEIVEKRAPSVNLVRRVPNVLKNLARLVWVIRIKG